MKRFGLRTVLCLTALIALSLASFESWRAANRRVSALVEHVDLVLDDIIPVTRKSIISSFERAADSNPTYSAFRNENEGVIRLYANRRDSDAGGGSSKSFGGVLSGPTRITRTVVLSMMRPTTDFSDLPIREHDTRVNISIEYAVPWRWFAGAPRVTITDNTAPDNAEFLKLLTQELSDLDIEFVVRRITK